MGSSYNRYNSLDVDVTSADPAGVFEAALNQGVAFSNIRTVDDLTVRVTCRHKDIKVMEQIVMKHGGGCRVCRSRIDILSGIKKRAVLLFGCLFFCLLIFLFTTRIFFVRVQGNVSVPVNEILEGAENCGIYFGASRRNVRSEKVKNALLESVPQLQWVGINTNGCVATISVREKGVEELGYSFTGVGRIVADTDGIIQNCTVLNGTPMCDVGDVVLAGQTLVSGYTDCGIAIRAVKANAEITALTIREISALAPKPYTIRTGQIRTEKKYSIRIGKKLINFFKDSGISDTGCVKMYSECFLMLPGGFQLPVSLITQCYTYCDSSDEWQQDWDRWMAEGAEEYLKSSLQACQIIGGNTETDISEDFCCFTGKYICLEDIGQFVNEEIIKDDRQTN